MYGSNSINDTSGIPSLNDRQGTASGDNNRIGRIGMGNTLGQGSGSVFQGMASRQIMNANSNKAGSSLQVNNDISDFGNIGGNSSIPTFGGRHRI